MCMEGSTAAPVTARGYQLYRGLRPGHGIKGLCGNLGDPERSSVMGVVADNPKRRGSHEDALEVGPTHSRGVVRVIPGAGMRLTRRGWQLHAERGGNILLV